MLENTPQALTIFPFIGSGISFVVGLVTTWLRLALTMSPCCFLFTVNQDAGTCVRGRSGREHQVQCGIVFQTGQEKTAANQTLRINLYYSWPFKQTAEIKDSNQLTGRIMLLFLNAYAFSFEHLVCICTWFSFFFFCLCLAWFIDNHLTCWRVLVSQHSS